MSEILVKLENLTKHFSLNGKRLKAVNGVNLEIPKGQTLGLVGESGCGKSTIGKLVTRLVKPTCGKFFYNDIDVFTLRSKEEKKLKRKIQIIFQNPFDCLNPLMSVEELLLEPMIIHKTLNFQERYLKVNTLLDLVALPRNSLKKYPHEFSGGQRQRISIARALSLNPEFLILDEPLSALDVSIQAQIINLLSDLQKEFQLTYLFISHNLAAVKYLSDKIAVMYLGEIVEIGDADKIYQNPMHPYTKALIDSIPTSIPHLGPRKKLSVIQGELPSLTSNITGCPFSSRCPTSQKICFEKKPQLSAKNKVLCHFPPVEKS